MAKEPENLVLRLPREVRMTQDAHSADLNVLKQDASHLKPDVSHLKDRVDDLCTISIHTLGVAANAHVGYEILEAKANELPDRVTRLEAER